MSPTSSAAAMPDAIVFAPNTHDFLVRLVRRRARAATAPLRVLTSDGEFHSARRQFARWAEERRDRSSTGSPPSRSTTFSERFLDRGQERRA